MHALESGGADQKDSGRLGVGQAQRAGKADTGGELNRLPPGMKDNCITSIRAARKLSQAARAPPAASRVQSATCMAWFTRLRARWTVKTNPTCRPLNVGYLVPREQECGAADDRQGAAEPVDPAEFGVE